MIVQYMEFYTHGVCIGIVLLVFMCICVYVLYKQQPILPESTVSPPTVDETTPTLSAHTTETWCFVGEDLSGRHCVKVPSEASCVPDRTFRTQSECALIQASHMPAGIVQENGQLRTLGSMNIQDSDNGR